MKHKSLLLILLLVITIDKSIQEIIQDDDINLNPNNAYELQSHTDDNEVMPPLIANLNKTQTRCDELRTITEEKIQEFCKSTVYHIYLKCVQHNMKTLQEHRVKRERPCDCDDDYDICDDNVCENSCKQCGNECSSCSSCSTCPTQSCCHRHCRRQCRTSSCRRACVSDCNKNTQSNSNSSNTQKTFVTNTNSSSNTNTNNTVIHETYNITTRIEFNNAVNASSVVDIPISINTTNVNNITLKGETAQPNPPQCCYLVYPMECVNTTVPPYRECYHRKQKLCGAQCNIITIPPPVVPQPPQIIQTPPQIIHTPPQIIQTPPQVVTYVRTITQPPTPCQQPCSSGNCQSPCASTWRPNPWIYGIPYNYNYVVPPPVANVRPITCLQGAQNSAAIFGRNVATSSECIYPPYTSSAQYAGQSGYISVQPTSNVQSPSISTSTIPASSIPAPSISTSSGSVSSIPISNIPISSGSISSIPISNIPISSIPAGYASQSAGYYTLPAGYASQASGYYTLPAGYGGQSLGYYSQPAVYSGQSPKFITQPVPSSYVGSASGYYGVPGGYSTQLSGYNVGQSAEYIQVPYGSQAAGYGVPAGYESQAYFGGYSIQPITPNITSSETIEEVTPTSNENIGRPYGLHQFSTN